MYGMPVSQNAIMTLLLEVQKLGGDFVMDGLQESSVVSPQAEGPLFARRQGHRTARSAEVTNMPLMYRDEEQPGVIIIRVVSLEGEERFRDLARALRKKQRRC